MGSRRQKERAEKESHGHTGKDNLKNRPFLAAKKGSLMSSENTRPS